MSPKIILPSQKSLDRLPIQLTPFLADLETAISARVNALTQAAVDSRPAWSVPLGAVPEDPEVRAAWNHHVGIVAAYRDQAKVLPNDAWQILGPYAEPGRHDHTAYWHAVDSVIAAHRLAGIEAGTGNSAPEDRARAQVATDLYLPLPADERAAIQNAMVERRGELWFGGTSTSPAGGRTGSPAGTRSAR